MARFIPVEYFWEKVDTFGGITFFPLLPDLTKFSVPFVWIIRAFTFYKNFFRNLQYLICCREV